MRMACACSPLSGDDATEKKTQIHHDSCGSQALATMRGRGIIRPPGSSRAGPLPGRVRKANALYHVCTCTLSGRSARTSMCRVMRNVYCRAIAACADTGRRGNGHRSPAAACASHKCIMHFIACATSCSPVTTLNAPSVNVVTLADSMGHEVMT